MMTMSEVFNEMKECEAKVRQLQKEVMAENDKYIAMAKIDEMLILAKRASELDTLHKSLLTAKLKMETKKLSQKLKEMRTKAP